MLMHLKKHLCLIHSPNCSCREMPTKRSTHVTTETTTPKEVLWPQGLCHGEGYDERAVARSAWFLLVWNSKGTSRKASVAMLLYGRDGKPGDTRYNDFKSLEMEIWALLSLSDRA